MRGIKGAKVVEDFLKLERLYENNFVTAIMCFERAGDTTWEILAKTILPRGVTATSRWREKRVDEKYKDREMMHRDKDKEKEKDKKDREREKERVREREIREKERERERAKEKE
nr:hypothetical protein [Tanacetum cinerariifolium]